MEQLTTADALNLMQSDMKLWERAQKVGVKGGLRLSLNLPWGIGEYDVTLENLNDAQSKRNAVTAYGNHIREVIKDRIDDDAITARAKLAAANREQADSADRIEVSARTRVREQTVQAAASAQAGEAHPQHAETALGFGEALVARRLAVTDRIDWELNTISNSEYELDRLRRELRGIDAALRAMGGDSASTDSRETEASPEEPPRYVAGIND